MARKIKFALEMKDGAKVRNSLEELRENFDLEGTPIRLKFRRKDEKA